MGLLLAMPPSLNPPPGMHTHTHTHLASDSISPSLTMEDRNDGEVTSVSTTNSCSSAARRLPSLMRCCCC